MTDFLELSKALELLVEEGIVEERYDEKRGDLVYSLTEKGEKFALDRLSESVDAFDFLFKVVLNICVEKKHPVLAVIEFLLWFIYHVHYKIPAGPAVVRAKRWFVEEEGESGEA